MITAEVEGMRGIEKSYKNKNEYVNMNECQIFICPTAKPLFCSEECWAQGAACQFAKYLPVYSDERHDSKAEISKVFSVRIKWLDDQSESDVYIAESHGIEDLPDGFADDNIFFYGMSENNILRAITSGEPCENEWVIAELYG